MSDKPCLTLVLSWEQYDANDQTAEERSYRLFRTEDGRLLTYKWIVPADVWKRVLDAEDAIRTGAAQLRRISEDFPGLYTINRLAHENSIRILVRQLTASLPVKPAVQT